MSAEPGHVILRVPCDRCHRAVELECRGLKGFWDYESYQEYLCPHCGRRNHPRTPGTIVSTRVPVDGHHGTASTPALVLHSEDDQGRSARPGAST